MITADNITDVRSPTVADIEAAFDDGRLYVIVDDARTLGRSSFIGSNGFQFDDKGSTVHVMSKPAGGEIRGYMNIGGELRLRLPTSPLHWDELDEVIGRRLALPVVNRFVSEKGCGLGYEGTDCCECANARTGASK